MATLDWELTRSGEVTLVELTVNSEFDQHVRIESELTPVWPPRRQSVPHTGWNGETFEGNVSQDETLVCGYASPAEPVEPPAAIAATESPDEETSVCPRDIVQTLGEPSPPRDTLEGSTAQTERVEGSTAPTEGVETSPPSNEGLAVTQVGKDETEVTTTHGHSSVADTPTPETEAEPTAWFDAVEDRVATTEQLAQTADAEDVRDVVADVGGIEDVRALQAQLDADRRQLSELQQRTETLSERLATVELPLATLERIV